MDLVQRKVNQRPVFPLVYISNRDSQKYFLAKLPKVSKLIIQHSDHIGSSKYLKFYKLQKKVVRITLLTLRHSKSLSQLRNIFYNLRSFTIFTIFTFEKLFFTFFRRLEFLIIKLNKAPTHSILKKQTIPSLKMMATPDAHFSRIRLAKNAEKIEVLDTFVVNIQPFAFLRNLKELSFNFDENFERNEVKVKTYHKIISYLRLKKLRIQESINGISKFRYLDFLALQKEMNFTLDVSITPRRLSLNSKIYYTPSNVFEKMVTKGVNSFTFLGTPKMSTGNLLDSPALCTNEEQYIAYLNGMIDHFNRFKTDVSYDQMQSISVLNVIYKILTLENGGINLLTLNMTLCEDFYKILLEISPHLDKIAQINISLEIKKDCKPSQFLEYEEKLLKISSPKKLPELTFKVQLNNIANLENLTSFMNSIQHLTWKKSFFFRLTQTCSPIILKILIDKLREVKNLDLGTQCMMVMSHVGLANKEEYDISRYLVELGTLILRRSTQLNYEGTVLSDIYERFKQTLQFTEEVLKPRYFTKIISFQTVTQTGKPLFMP